MAGFTIELRGIEEYRKKILALGVNLDGICRYAIYPAADIVIDAIKANTPVNTGDLRKSAKLYKFQHKEGFVYTGVFFDGYDERGVPNPIKARVLESGSSTRKKHPFIRPAVNRVKKAAEFAMDKALNEKISQIMEKG